MDEVKKKLPLNDINNENIDENLINLKRLHDGYSTIIDKLGYGKFKPYLQRLFHSVEIMIKNEEIEFKKIDSKYQDMVRQCHIYEKTLTMLKENNNNCCELSSFSDSSNTYAADDLTKVTPYLAPDLLQSTLGATNTNVNTSIQFRLPRRRSSLSNRQYVSTPLGINRTSKPSVPLAHFDDDSSFGFQMQKIFVDASTDPHPIEQMDFSIQINPLTIDQQIETNQFIFDCQSTQTDSISRDTIACQINPISNEFAIQTDQIEQKDFSLQISPHTNEQICETDRIDYLTESIQTDLILKNDYSCQITPEYQDENIETIPILTEDIGLQSSFDHLIFEDQQIQTDILVHNDVETQYDEELIKISLDQHCQTNIDQENQSTQTLEKILQHSSTQSNIIKQDHQLIQTDFPLNSYSSSIHILPIVEQPAVCLSKIFIYPKSYRDILTTDKNIQCDLNLNDSIISIPIAIENEKVNDRQSVLQQQLDEKEKQMNRIIEEYATLYGEYESERRRNMDLIEARDRLADHIKVLSDELGDREINQEMLLIKSCQQNKLINYMLPQIDCSPTPKKKQNSASSFRRLLPKFK